MDIALFGQVTNKISTYAIVAEVCKYLLSTFENLTSNHVGCRKKYSNFIYLLDCEHCKSSTAKILAGL